MNCGDGTNSGGKRALENGVRRELNGGKDGDAKSGDGKRNVLGSGVHGDANCGDENDGLEGDRFLASWKLVPRWTWAFSRAFLWHQAHVLNRI